MRPILEANPQPLSGYSWGSLSAWREIFQYRWAFLDEKTIVIAYEYPGGATWRLLQPVGEFSATAQQRLIEAARKLPHALEIDGITGDFAARHPEFVAHFDLRWDRDYANYIYSAEDLATLSGRKFAKKRNLVSQAANAYTWTIEALTSGEAVRACLVKCREIAEDKLHLMENGGTAKEAGADFLHLELKALEKALERFQTTGFGGVVLRVEGEIAGFAMYEPISEDTAFVHFEKAERRYKGIYQVLNQEVAKILHGRGFRWINREDDMGNPGLRQAKESYNPVRLEPFGRMVLRKP